MLFRAAYRGLKDVVEMLLLAGANPWHIDSQNMTAFEVAARYNCTDCLPVRDSSMHLYMSYMSYISCVYMMYIM